MPLLNAQICDGTDNRVHSNYRPIGRILAGGGATCWIASNGMLVTARHVRSTGLYVEFNVPASLSDGTPQPAPDTAKYQVNDNSWIDGGGAVGTDGDWAVFTVYDNAITGKQPFTDWGSLQEAIPTTTGTYTVAGYGYDGPPPDFGSVEGGFNSDSQTLQQDSGPDNGSTSDYLKYSLDTQGGCSGSPVILNGSAIGVHCQSCNASFQGISFSNSAFWNALHPTVTVNQKLSNGSTATGTTVKRWTGSSFGQILNPGDQISGSTPSTETKVVEALQGYQQISSSQKYFVWSKGNTNETDVKNHHVFHIEPSFNGGALTSWLNPVNDNATVKADLSDYSGTYPNIAKFMDPWYVNYPDPSYGNTYRNLGMSAPFENMSGSTNDLGTGTTYKGVFWNEPVVSGGTYYSVQAPLTNPSFSVNGSGVNGSFLNWSTSNANLSQPVQNPAGYDQKAVVFTNTGAVITANYKGIHISNDASAFANNSQRKFIRTTNGWYHQVYTSTAGGFSRVWIEHSPDGVNWTIGNGGQPLDYGGGKNPSIDYNGDVVAVVFQQQYGNNWEIIVQTFYLSGNSYVLGIGYPLFTGSTPYSNNVNPNLAWSGTSGLGMYMISWESGGIYYSYGGLASLNVTPYIWSSLLPGTDGNSVNASLYTIKGDPNGTFEIAWQENVNGNTASIKYGWFYFYYDGSFWHIGSEEPVVQISSSSFQNNYRPSMISDPSYNWYASWIGDYNGSGSQYTVRIVYTNYVAFNNNVYYTYGYNTLPKSCAINIAGNGAGAYFSWSESIPSYANRLVDVGNVNTIKTLNTSGKDVQMCSSGTRDGMCVEAFYPFSTPYSFAKSNNLPTFFPKTSPSALASERGCFIGNGVAHFFYSFGNITVDNTNVDFVDAPDTVSYGSLSKLNAALVSQPIQVTPTSKFTFTELSSFSDSASVLAALGDSGYVKFKVDLVDNASGNVIGTVKSFSFAKGSIVAEAPTGFVLNTGNLTAKTVRVKITVSTNLDNPEVALVKSLTDGNTNFGSSTQGLSLHPLAIITDYSLDQNFPNPFNPSTVISYSIPKDGMVTLKIFDALGREVKTLVSEKQTVGRYNVTFDALRLSSGVYFYRLVSGNYVSTKKMLILK